MKHEIILVGNDEIKIKIILCNIALESLINKRNKILDTWRYFIPFYKKRLKQIDITMDKIEALIEEVLEEAKDES